MGKAQENKAVALLSHRRCKEAFAKRLSTGRDSFVRTRPEPWGKRRNGRKKTSPSERRWLSSRLNGTWLWLWEKSSLQMRTPQA